MTPRDVCKMTPEEARRFLAFHYGRDFWLLKPMVRCVRLALS